MISEIKVGRSSWVSLVNPSRKDIDTLREEFSELHPLILEDLRTPTIRPLSENYDHHLYMVMHFPAFMKGEKKVASLEVDFILTKHALISVQYHPVLEIDEFWNECREKTEVTEQYGKSPAHLIYYLMKKMFAQALQDLDQIQFEIDQAEEEVFAGREKEIFTDITILKRDVLDFSRAIKPQRMTLESLLEQGPALFGEQAHPFFNGLLAEYTRVANLLENHKEALDGLYDTASSQLATKTNEIMRVFTILAFISFIPTAIANVYGMNVINIPFAESENAFFIAVGFMLAFTGGVYLALKWKKLI